MSKIAMSAAEIVDQKLTDGVQDLAVQDQVLSRLPLLSLNKFLLILNYFLFMMKNVNFALYL